MLERDSVPGGRAGVLAEAGFQLDTGPTVLTMPEVLSATFAAAGSELADFVRLHPVDPMYRAVFGDGSTLYIRRGREAMTEEIRAFSGAHDAEAFGRFSDWLESLHRIEMSHFVDVNFDSPFDLVRSWRAVASLVGRGGFGRIGQADGLVLRRRAAAAGLRFAVVVRGPRAAPGAGDPDRRHPHRHARRVRARRRDAHDRQEPRGRGRKGRCDDPLPIARHAVAARRGRLHQRGRGRRIHPARGRRGRVQRRPPGRVPNAARRRRRATCRPARPLRAVVPALDRRRAR